MTRDTDTTTTIANPETKETEMSTVAPAPPAASKSAEKRPRKSKFTGKLKSAKKPTAKKPAKPAKKSAKSKQPAGRRVRSAESALRAVVEGRAVPSGPRGFPPDVKIVMLNREGSVQHANFEHIKRSAAAGKSVSKCKENVADPHGIQYALRRYVDSHSGRSVPRAQPLAARPQLPDQPER